MDSRVRVLNKHLKDYDKDLVAMRLGDRINVYRYTNYWETFEWEDKRYYYAKRFPQFILSLSHNWLADGSPVDWGIEPLMRKIREMDQWRDDSMYENLVKERERKDELLKREQRNVIKAAAYDLRAEFAKATNDINTSTLDKIDRRRLKDGYC